MIQLNGFKRSKYDHISHTSKKIYVHVSRTSLAFWLADAKQIVNILILFFYHTEQIHNVQLFLLIFRGLIVRGQRLGLFCINWICLRNVIELRSSRYLDFLGSCKDIDLGSFWFTSFFVG